jgi:hypothetical protein
MMLKKIAFGLSILLFAVALIFPLFPLVDGVITPHFFPDSPIFSIEYLGNSTVNVANPQIPLQFSVELDVGTGIHYDLLPSGEWFKYGIDGAQNFTAAPNAISHNTATVTSHNGGPTKHETTRYTVTLKLTEAAIGLHQIVLYIGITDNLIKSSTYRALGSFNVTIFGPTSSPTPSPSIPEFPSLTISLLLSLILVVAGVLVYHKKHKHNLVTV